MVIADGQVFVHAQLIELLLLIIRQQSQFRVFDLHKLAQMVHTVTAHPANRDLLQVLVSYSIQILMLVLLEHLQDLRTINLITSGSRCHYFQAFIAACINGTAPRTTDRIDGIDGIYARKFVHVLF